MAKLSERVYTGVLGGEAGNNAVRLALALIATGRVDAPRAELMNLAGLADPRSLKNGMRELEALGLVDFRAGMLKGVLTRGDERCPTCGQKHAPENANTRHEHENVPTTGDAPQEAATGTTARYTGNQYAKAPADATARDVLSDIDSWDASGDFRTPGSPVMRRRRAQIETLTLAWAEVFPNATDNGPDATMLKRWLAVEDGYAVDVYDAWVKASKATFRVGPLAYLRGTYERKAAEKAKTREAAQAARGEVTPTLANPLSTPRLADYGDKRPWTDKDSRESKRLTELAIANGWIDADELED